MSARHHGNTLVKQVVFDGFEGRLITQVIFSITDNDGFDAAWGSPGWNKCAGFVLQDLGADRVADLRCCDS